MTEQLPEPRTLNVWEQGIIAYLLSHTFPGVEKLRAQFITAVVTEEYGSGDPSVVLLVDHSDYLKANVRRRVPIEAFCNDYDEAEIQILLHVVDGYMSELEVYRPDGKDVISLPQVQSLNAFCPDADSGDSL
ncbi:MAG: hypothetical protein IT306_15015 [Chloroflexi bacterium]|nr:hypothetical protein [Chloroflexota bacterium]